MDEPRLDVAVDALGRIAREGPPLRAQAPPEARPAPPPAGPGLAPSLLLLLLVFAATALSARSRACLELDAYARRRSCGRPRGHAKRAARRRPAPLPHLGPPTLFALALLVCGCASVRLGGGAAVPAPPGPEPARAAEPSALHPPPPPSALDRSSVTLTTAPRD